MDAKQQHDEVEWDRLLLLLTSKPRPGFEEFFEEVCLREVRRLMPLPVGYVEEGDGDDG